MPNLQPRNLLPILTLALVAAPPTVAATKAPPTSFAAPPADQALVYAIRQPRFQGSGRSMFVYVDESLLGVLENGSYTYATVPPGAHLLWLNWARISDEVELEAGRTYYFDIWTDFTPLDETTGRAMAEAMRAYTTPEPKELATAEDHIRVRYAKAEQRGAEEDAAFRGREAKREAHVARWPEVDLTPFSTLVVEDFTVSDPQAGERKKAYLIESLPRRMADLVAADVAEDAFAEVVVGALAEPRPDALVLRVDVTQYKPGSETARLMLAGTGSAKLDFSARLVDGGTGAELTSFAAERTFAWGGVYGASRGIEDIERNVAYELALYLRQAKGVAAD